MRKIEVETNPCWIDYYKVKLVELKKSIKKLDPDHKFYWRDRTRLTRDLRQVEARLGITTESSGKRPLNSNEGLL